MSGNSSIRVPVTCDSCEHVGGPFFRRARFALEIGDELAAGRGSHVQAGRGMNDIHVTALADTAACGAELALAMAATGARGHRCVVEPLGPVEDDPHVTDKRSRGNVTESYRTRHPLRVAGGVDDREGHDPEVLRGDARPPGDAP